MFGVAQELVFQRTSGVTSDKEGHCRSSLSEVSLHVPQPNNSIVSYCRDVDINWKNGLTFVPESDQQSLKTLFIMVWGYTKEIIEEPGSPSLLGQKGGAYCMKVPTDSHKLLNPHKIGDKASNAHFTEEELVELKEHLNSKEDEINCLREHIAKLECSKNQLSFKASTQAMYDCNNSAGHQLDTEEADLHNKKKKSMVVKQGVLDANPCYDEKCNETADDHPGNMDSKSTSIENLGVSLQENMVKKGSKTEKMRALHANFSEEDNSVDSNRLSEPANKKRRILNEPREKRSCIYLFNLVVLFVRSNGGEVYSGELGKFLSASDSSHDSNAGSANQEIKSTFGSLSGFIGHYNKTMERVYVENGNFRIILRKPYSRKHETRNSHAYLPASLPSTSFLKS